MFEILEHLLHVYAFDRIFSDFQIQSYIFISSFFITEYSLSDINLQGTDLFPLKFPLYNRIFT